MYWIITIKIELNHDSVSLTCAMYRGTSVIVNIIRHNRSTDRNPEYSSIIIILTFNGTNPAGKIYGWLIFAWFGYS